MKATAINTTHIKALIVGAAFLAMSLAPFMAQAASKTPSCTLTVTTESSTTKITKEGSVTVAEDEEIEIDWEAKNATSATYEGKRAVNSGTATIVVKKSADYTFVAKNGNKKVTCEVTVNVAEASIDSKSLSKGSEKPTITGTADGLKKVSVAIYKEGANKPVFEKKSISVKNDKWSVKVSKNLPKGDYEVRLYAYKSTDVLDEEELTVGSTKRSSDDKDEDDDSTAKSEGVLSVGMIPLGMGGSAQIGKPFSATLVEIRNRGTEEVKITGFGVRQTGTASMGAITMLSTVDNKGVATAARAASFKSNIATAPVDAVIPPGGVMLFTVKATVGPGAVVGSTVVLDLISIQSNAKSVSGTFPIRGNAMSVI
ncbi:MAG TPA: hypothetical protein VF696_00275 [Candidatus Paceibacterota bacterium]